MLTVTYPKITQNVSAVTQDTILEEKPVPKKNRIVEESPEKEKEDDKKKTEKLDKTDTSGEIKHTSFDCFLKTNFGHIINPKQKSGSEVPLESRAFLKEFSYSYKVNRDCKNHEPYPKAMCSACIPPSIHMKRQVYRHVDYAQIMNSEEVGRLIRHWFQTSMQRVGYLYGYYAEDPTYEDGDRAVVEAIYEPPQQNDLNNSIILPDQLQTNVDKISARLGLQRIGYVFTTYNNDVFLTSEEVMQAARFQEAFQITHPVGVTVSKQIIMVLRRDSKKGDEVIPEVYMMSDQCQSLVRDGLLLPPDDRKHLKLKESDG